MRVYSRDTDTRPSDMRPNGGIRLAERERPQVAHHAVHESREAQETRLDKHQEFDANRVLNNTYLEAPPPRPGYKQRWVADGTGTNGADNPTAERNWWMKQRQGWAVRDPETVPQELRHLYPSARLGNGADAIRVARQVLCEMPVNVMHQRSLAVRDLIGRQNQAVMPSTEELRKKPRPGFGPVEVEEEVKVARGQNPELRSRGLPSMTE